MHVPRDQDLLLKKKWGQRKIPMHILVEEFLADNIAFRKDVLQTLEQDRDKFIDWRRAPLPLSFAALNSTVAVSPRV
eukprot:51303-Pleurochrysis_carterae.AAC.2